MSANELEHGVKRLTASLDREIEQLRLKVVDRVLRIEDDAQAMLKYVNAQGAEGATTIFIAANLRELEKLQADLAEHERARQRIEEMVLFARRSAS